MKTQQNARPGLFRLAAGVGLVLLSTVSLAQTNDERLQIDAPPWLTDASFGLAVALSGNNVLCSAPGPWDPSTGFPAYGRLRRVYVHDATTGQLLRQLEGSTGDFEDGFGWSIAAEGNTVLIGAPYDDDLGLQSGAVYFFDLQTGAELARLHAANGDELDHFGAPIATDGDLVAIGATGTRVGFSRDGVVYVVDPETGAVRTRLVSSTPTAKPAWPDWSGWSEYWGIWLGGSLAYDGGTVVAGAVEDLLAGEGTCLVFDDVAVNSGSAYCFGDGSGPSCPCGTDGYLGEGCASSIGRGGYLLGSGNASVANDELQLQALRLPAATPVLLFQGSTPTAQVFGEGILCAHPQFRYDVRFSSSVGSPDHGLTGAVVFEGLGQHASPGSTLYYQCWYRDAASACGLGGFNLTNGWTVTW